MGWVGTAATVVGAGVGIWSSLSAAESAEDQASDQAREKKRIAAQNKELAYEDALIAESEAAKIENTAGYIIKQKNEMSDRVLGTQMARYAKSGVVAGSGTPTQVMETSKRNMDQDIQMVKYNGKTAAEEKRDLAVRFRKMGDAGLSTAIYQGMLLESAAADQATAYKTQAISTGLITLGTVATQYYEGQSNQ